VCEYYINRAPDTPIFTNFEPLHSSPSTVAPIAEGAYAVVRVIDGDTLIIINDAGTEYRVRLIGIDAPEIRPIRNNHTEQFDNIIMWLDIANSAIL
jgi:endonuclease YncB( thermonuclease family)